MGKDGQSKESSHTQRMTLQQNMKRRNTQHNNVALPPPVISTNEDGGSAKRESILRQLRKLWSIQTLLLFVILFSVAGVAATVWSLNYTFAMRGVKEVSKKARHYQISNLVERIGSTLDLPMYVRIANRMFLQLQRYDRTATITRDRNAQFAIFSSVLRSSPLVTLTFARADGFVTTVKRDQDIFYAVTVNMTCGPQIVRPMDPETMEIGEMMNESSSFNATDRPWYKFAVQSDKMTWLDKPFVTPFISPDLLLSVTVPYKNITSGELLGVIHGGIDLKGISSKIRTMEKEKNTRFILISSEGYLLGTSIGETFTSVNGTPVLIKAQEHSDPVIRRTVIELLKAHTYTDIPVRTAMELKYGRGGSMKRISAQRISDSYGLNVIAITVLKENDIMNSVYVSNKICACICSVAIVLAIVLSALVGCLITRPLKRICKEMDNVANMDFTEGTRISSLRLYEMEEMSQSMNQMKLGLRNFEKYVPSSVVQCVLQNNCKVVLGVVPREVTVMFADVKDFTSIAETVRPDILVSIIYDLFTHMSDIIIGRSGVVDKYIGDAIMALFNAPVPVDNHEILAVTAALEMQERLHELNEDWKLRGFPQLQCRIGINSANCLVGNIGSQHRVNYTALGDGVNVAARCESLNKDFQTGIIISQSTYKVVREKFLCRWLTAVRLKGKTRPIDVYEVVCEHCTATKQQIITCGLHLELENALECADYERSRLLCEYLLELDENNISAKIILERLCSADFCPENLVSAQT